MDRRFVKQRDLTVGQQTYVMRVRCPGFQCALERSCVTWTGYVQPTEMSSKYLIRIWYALGRRPRVSVLNPQLRRRSLDEKIPHLFPGNYLCLYHPRYGEWLATMFIAETIIPWAALWLYYYEVWHATGTWYGGGEHPRTRKPRSRRKK